MAQGSEALPAQAAANVARGVAERATPTVRKISVGDLAEVMGAGLADFRRTSRYGLFFGLFYAGGGWLILLLLRYFNLPFLAYPMAMGFALIAPFVVVGLYAVSRALERGEPLSWSYVLGSMWDARNRDLRWMALVSSFSFVIWMDIAAILFFGFLGFRPVTADLVNELLTTPSGLLFLAIGHITGAVIAFGIFSFSVVSFPLLFDRDIDFVTAMVTSVKAVIENPLPMAIWCAMIGGLVLVSLLSVFVGLIVVLPVLGHASWHLYRRVVAPVAGQ